MVFVIILLILAAVSGVLGFLVKGAFVFLLIGVVLLIGAAFAGFASGRGRNP